MGKAFRMICNFGEAIVLDTQYLDEIKNHHGLSFGKWLAEVWKYLTDNPQYGIADSREAFMAHIPGFESYSAWVIDKKVLTHVALVGITPALGKYGFIVRDTRNLTETHPRSLCSATVR